MKKLPNNVQSLFTASTHINSFKRAVEELVYNALDANSSSVAIRLNFEDYTLQVIDNGCGIKKHDMKLVGQKHMTSKTLDKSLLKSTSNNYGFRGQSLASIIEVSEMVKITSRFEDDETFEKTLCQGIEKDIHSTVMRPSKGTTVQIKGFLYNLNIQKRNIDSLTELQDIKEFFGRLSLVHSNISISLRDDLNNEIIFQVHKSRDIYQTLHSLFGIEEASCMELKVEKKSYKVLAYIGKTVSDENENHWIYLNGRYLKNCKLHNIFDEEMMKGLGIKKGGNYNPKLGQAHDDNRLFKKKIPFYFIFITCPYTDYDLNYTGNKTNLEFKEWKNVATLMQKLAKFYIGDAITQAGKNKTNTDNKDTDTRDEVKKIVDKFLGNNLKNPGVSQMQNGIKGPMTKRKRKNKNKLSLTKVISEKNTKPTVNLNKANDLTETGRKELKESQKNKQTNRKTKKDSKKVTEKNKIIRKITTHNRKDKQKTGFKNLIKTKARNELVKAFEMEIDNSQMQKKCKLAAAKAEKLLQKKIRNNKKVSQLSVTEGYSIFKTNIQTISVRKQTEEVIASDIVTFKEPVLHKRRVTNQVATDLVQKYDKCAYDLLQTILKSQSNIDVRTEVQYEYSKSNDRDSEEENKLTFQSHNYNVDERYVVKEKTFKAKTNKFISTKSRDNFISGHVFRRPNQMPRPQPYSRWKRKPCALNIELESSYTIEFTEENNILNTVLSQLVPGNTYSITSRKHTVVESSRSITENYVESANENNETYTIDIHDSNQANSLDEFDHELVDESRKDEKRNQHVDFVLNRPNTASDENDSLALEPLNICETLLNDSNHEDEDLTKASNDEVHITNQSNMEIINDVISSPVQVPSIDELLGETSHHFQQTIEDELQHEFAYDFIERQRSNSTEISMETVNKSGQVYQLHKKTGMTFGGDKRSKSCDFNLKDRFGFMPKGLSPILQKCHTKNACDYDLESEYFNDSMYNDFARDIEVNTEIFEAKVQKVKDLATKHIEKVNNKLKKDNASLSFDGACLKEAKIIGQVDCKFIAAIIKGSSGLQHLVLFDQHAVHERIRLEDNMAEYLINDQWESVGLEHDLEIKLKRDEMIYLHNYKDKISQLGLKWTVGNNSVAISGIPKAILGKNPRQVEVIMKAAKSLIQEEIQALKAQRGSLSLYPKSIMDLVFSEACRYAIKFGDSLSIKECSQLLLQLSSCRAPFQCAHGRPALAVLLDITPSCLKYKINLNKLKSFRDSIKITKKYPTCSRVATSKQ